MIPPPLLSKSAETDFSDTSRAPAFQGKILPPLPLLPSWSVLLLVLQFFGWLDQVLELLSQLSGSSRAYMRRKHDRDLLVQ